MRTPGGTYEAERVCAPFFPHRALARDAALMRWPFGGRGGGCVSSPASSTSSIARATHRHAANVWSGVKPVASSAAPRPFSVTAKAPFVFRVRSRASSSTRRTASFRSQPSFHSACTAGMSFLEKNASRRAAAAGSVPAINGACDSAASMATRV